MSNLECGQMVDNQNQICSENILFSAELVGTNEREFLKAHPVYLVQLQILQNHTFKIILAQFGTISTKFSPAILSSCRSCRF
jgi:hypothetical protein